jgi:hypothetical protein
MPRMTTTCLALLVGLAMAEGPTTISRGLVAIEAARQDAPANVAGAWALTIDTGQGTATPGVTFQQDGEKLTGTYSSQIFGEQKITGSVKGNAITFGFTATMEGNTFQITYTGTVEKDTMKGKVSFGDAGEGTFTGKKK